jgi:ribosomal-protein-alanine N-acetyltransferase
MSSPAALSITIRRMGLADLEEVFRIEHAAHKKPWSLDLLRKELDHDWSTVLLAVDQSNDAVAGYIIFWLVHDEVHVLNVATDPARRRNGFGRALMAAAEADGQRRGAVLATLEVRRSNEPAQALYRGLGYRQVGVRPRYYADDNEDALVMTKDLPCAALPVPHGGFS